MKRYLIVCPSDLATGTAYDINGDTTGADVVLNKWAQPYYMGAGVMTEIIGYVWSDKIGAVRAYKPQANSAFGMGGDAAAGDKCTVAAYDAAYSQNIKSQKASFKVTLTQKIDLSGSATERKYF